MDGTGMGLRGDRIHRYVNAFCPHCHVEPPDRETFLALDLGYEVARDGGTCGAVLNAANEEAVGRFLAGDIGFLDIPLVCKAVLANHQYNASPSLDELLAGFERQPAGVHFSRIMRLPSPSPGSQARLLFLNARQTGAGKGLRQAFDGQ